MSIATLFGIIAAILVGAVLLAAVIFLFSKIFRFTFLILRNIFRFIGEEVTDTLRLIGAILASVLFAPLVVLSIIIGRWSASKHYAGAFMAELRSASRCVYRIAIGNIARLFGVSKALEGVEHRVPEMMAAAPTRDKPSKRMGMFDGYTIVGSLKGGGSGGKLYIAEPDEIKQAVFAKRKLGEVEQVVIKVFSLKDGSSLPQIVRESRALDAARSLGLVLEHQMAPERFYYVMRYVPGESLSVMTQRLHSLSSYEGLEVDHMKSMMGYGEDLLIALDTYHNAELWHKDVKPDNIIIDGQGIDAKAHLVDFGLITPMRSAMTLTTHGTEYFRDPELVRQALRGVKVHQIDGSKFDVYGAGAVMFSMIENSFPAHGGLSQITKRCPEALRWIVRRSMAEYDRRYPSAAAMLADLRVVIEAQDPYSVKPIDLPSVSQGDVAAAHQVDSQPSPMYGQAVDEPVRVGGGSPVPPNSPRVAPAPRGGRVGRPNTRLTSWWSGKYVAVGGAHVQPKAQPKQGKGFVVEAGIGAQGPYANVNGGRVRPLRHADDRKPAAHQVRDARKRAQEMRTRAGKRINSSRHRKGSYGNTPGIAVVFAGLLGLVVILVGAVVGTAMFTEVFHKEYSASAPMSPMPPMVSINGEDITISDGQIIYSSSDERFVEEASYVLSETEMVDAQVLVVPMLAHPIDPDVYAELEIGLETLRTSGVTLIGDLSSTEESAIELTADLANSIGSVPVDSSEFTMKIQHWLLSQSFDGVLVLGTKPGESDSHRAMLVMDNFHTMVPITERTVHDLLTVLNNNGYTRE
jgi:serine/threonine protein kinase